MPPAIQGAPSAPEFKDWSIAAVRLLQGVVYADDPRTWDIVLRSRTQLDGHFARIGLVLVVDETEGYGYVRQWSEDECPEGYEQLPKLVRRVPLGYGPTLLAVLLRDELRRYEEEEVHDERCVVDADVLFDQWKAFFPAQHDEVKQRKEFAAALNKLDGLGFARRFADDPEQWEVKKILKARLPASELENLRLQLLDAASRGGQGGGDRDA
jgi:hypothetical protein